MTTQTKTTWRERKLGEIAQDIRESYLPTKEEKKPYVGLEHIEQQTLQFSDIGRSDETQSAKKVFKAGDILFGTLRPYFRKVVRPKFDGVCSTDIAVIRPTQKGDGAFLKYFIANQDFIDYASNISGGTRMPRANWKTLKETIWSLPELDEQKQIADVLSVYDDLIENNTKRIKILEQIAQAIYKEWSIKAISNGELPNGWEVSTLGEHLIGLESGSRPKGGVGEIKEGVPSVGAENINGIGRHDHNSEKYIAKEFFEKMKRGVVQDRDVALYKDGAYIGRSSYFRDGFPHKNFSVNEHVFLLRSFGERITQNFLYLWLREPDTIHEIHELQMQTRHSRV